MTPTPPQMSSRGRDTVLALLNIENQQDRIGALSNVLTNSHNLGLRKIDILAVVESFESPDRSNDYSEVTSHTWHGKPCKSKHRRRGVGFWVRNKINKCVSIVTPKTENENILWLQYVTNNGTYYIASGYIAPHKYVDHETLKSFYSALIDNYTEYAHEGTVVMLGDFNGHIPSTTGDKSTRPVTSHNNKLSHLINTLPGSGNKPDTN